MLNYLIVLALSMVPVIELRGAIPVGLYALGLDITPVVIISFIGNLIPIPFLILFGGKVLRYFASFEKFGKPFRKILEIGEKKVAKMSSGAKRALFWGLFLFVAIPLPGTGAWTGTLGASLLNMKFKDASLAVVLGVLIAGVIMSTASILAHYGINLVI